MIKEIISILDELITHHQRFVVLGKEKTEVIKKGDTALLERIVLEESTLNKKVEELERRRQLVLTQYLNDHGFLPQTITLEQFIQIAPWNERDHLKLRKDQLLAIVSQLQNINDLNRELIKQSLMFINLSLNLFQPRQQPVNYQPRAKGHKPSLTYHPTSARFDSKA